MWGIFCILLQVPHNNVMIVNDVMLQTTQFTTFEIFIYHKVIPIVPTTLKRILSV